MISLFSRLQLDADITLHDNIATNVRNLLHEKNIMDQPPLELQALCQYFRTKLAKYEPRLSHLEIHTSHAELETTSVRVEAIITDTMELFLLETKLT